MQKLYGSDHIYFGGAIYYGRGIEKAGRRWVFLADTANQHGALYSVHMPALDVQRALTAGRAILLMRHGEDLEPGTTSAELDRRISQRVAA